MIDDDEKTDALTDTAYYNGARHAMSALAGGMTDSQLTAEIEARVAPARKWLAENRPAKPLEPNYGGLAVNQPYADALKLLKVRDRRIRELEKSIDKRSRRERRFEAALRQVRASSRGVDNGILISHAAFERVRIVLTPADGGSEHG